MTLKSIEITGVKVKSKGGLDVTLHVNAYGGDGLMHLAFDEDPKQEFLDALDALKPHIRLLIGPEVPKAYMSNVTVSGLHIKYKKDRMGVIMTAKKPLENSTSPFNINTPLTFEASDDPDATGDRSLTQECVSSVMAVVALAQKYLDGDRVEPPKQTNLFDESEGDGQEGGE